jgi:hypothetical protein
VSNASVPPKPEMAPALELFPVDATAPKRPAHALRAPCRCGSVDGYIEARGNQDTVFCASCRAYQYNAPRLETGRAVRSLSSRPGITPSQRARIMEEFGHANIACGKRGRRQWCSPWSTSSPVRSPSVTACSTP